MQCTCINTQQQTGKIQMGPYKNLPIYYKMLFLTESINDALQYEIKEEKNYMNKMIRWKKNTRFSVFSTILLKYKYSITTLYVFTV